MTDVTDVTMPATSETTRVGVLRCGDRILPIGARTYLMGIVNVTPDSFSDGGQHATTEEAVAHALQLLEDGADVLDIGGESTRPGAAAVPVDVELARVLPVVQALAARGVRNVSIDTRRAAVAQACLRAGAAWVNDVSALQDDPAMGNVAARADAVVLMHRQHATHDAREDHVRYDDVVLQVREGLQAACERARLAGIAADSLVVDPGIGFGKTVTDNLALTRALSSLRPLAPVLYGPSRKRFLGALTGHDDPCARDDATVGAICFAACNGADFVRVHDVKRARDALVIVDALHRRPARG